MRSMKAQRSLIDAEQVPFNRIEQLARETKGQDERQLKLFDMRSADRRRAPRKGVDYMRAWRNRIYRSYAL